MARKSVVIGLLGPSLDQGYGADRWNRWRPSVGICQQDDFVVDRFELLVSPAHTRLADLISADIASVSPETEVRRHALTVKNPWDFSEVYAALGDFADGYAFAPTREDYYLHITTGTHVAQICLFLLCETRTIPGRLLQSSPARGRDKHGTVDVIDLDLGKYDRLAARFKARQLRGASMLKAGIDTRSAAFNRLIDDLEQVATRSKDPILLTGETGTGKSELCRRIYELKRARHQLEGELVAVNCATVRGDTAMSALFGHARGAFTGAAEPRTGFLRKADRGLLFLDEIGELGADEQAMLLKAIEEKRFYPLGADKEVASDFQLIAGTNRDLRQAVREGRFRDDLLARLSLWTFQLPALRDRPEDLAPNLDYELDRVAADRGSLVSMSKSARDAFLGFAQGGAWPGNFRDLGAAVRRMATLAEGGRIADADVAAETARLRAAWRGGASDDPLDALLGARAATLDRFDRVQLADVVAVCAAAPSLSAAGRVLFAQSREDKASRNDADRLRKYLARFALTFDAIRAHAGA
ncbi:MAG: RNA repair transcriptional activator RtcR [Deltaproteobacteria bacterium]|nr:RNA repair transcriptional activator RtcR [Deltaproteobacteria bacterium]